MSTSEFKPPLVPAEVDLRDFSFMPMDVLRLRDSDLAALSTGDEFKAAVLLWCVAWHQVPAGSLPNDDRLLARHSGAGASWKKVKVEALRGFVECSDGRLYHSTIAEKALESWDRKQRQRARTRAATDAREANRRVQHAGHHVERDDQRNVERDVERYVVQGTGTGTGTGTGIATLGVASARPTAEQPPQLALLTEPRQDRPGIPDCPHTAILALWAATLPALPQHIASMWKGARADHLRARWRETAEIENWADQEQGLSYFRKLFIHIGKSTFLTGRVQPRDQGRRPFVIELEWLVMPNNWAKVIEGKYGETATAATTEAVM